MDEAPSLFVCRSATRNAARSVPSPTGRTAATAHAAITRVWYEFGTNISKLSICCLIYTSETFILIYVLCFPSQFYPRGYSCRYAVNDCDISETCSGDSGQVFLCCTVIFVFWFQTVFACWRIMCMVKKESYICDSLQCPPNLHKQDGYLCQVNQVCRRLTLETYWSENEQVMHRIAADWGYIFFFILSEGPLLQRRVQDQREPV